MRIDGQVAFVTGGASGLGLATVKRLSEAGAKVVAFDLRGSDELTSVGGTFIEGDVTDEDSVTHALEKTAELGDLRIVSNCAGILKAQRVVGKTGPFSLADFRAVIDVNLVGTFNVVRLAAMTMMNSEPIDGERGVMVNTASVAAFEGQIGQAAYAASKAGIAGLTLPLARDLAKSQIRVMSIAPGTFKTPMMAGLSDEVQKSLGEQVPHPSRLGEPAEYAQLVQSIVENPMLNGETIRLDGAIRMGPR